jgi:hypothetical protein
MAEMVSTRCPFSKILPDRLLTKGICFDSRRRLDLRLEKSGHDL